MPLDEERKLYVESYAAQITESVKGQKQLYEKMAQNLCGSYTLAHELSGSGLTPFMVWQSMNDILSLFRSNMDVMPGIQRIEVYVRGSELLTDGRYIFTEEFDERRAVNGFLWTEEEIDGLKRLCLYKKVLWLNDSRMEAYIRIIVDGQKAFGTYMSPKQEMNMRAYLVDEGGKILLSTGGQQYEFAYLENGDFVSRGTWEGEQSELGLWDEVGEWRILTIFSPEYTEGKMRETYCIIGGIMFVIAMITGMALWVSLGRIFDRIGLLSERLERIGYDDEPIEIGKECDEVQRLEEQYNQMIRRLEHMVDEVAKERTQKQRFELRALESQIDPHFLYNTLGVMRWSAIDGESKRLVAMIDNLTAFYRLSYNQGRGLITIEEETELVRAYVELCQERCDYCVKVDIHMDDDVGKVRMPKMVLQPLVENIWLHGDITLPGRQYIRITIRKSAKGLVDIEVFDNGTGITQGRMREINSGAIEERRGIGTGYIRDILGYYYQDRFVFEIESREGEWTKVCLSIPNTPVEDGRRGGKS